MLTQDVEGVHVCQETVQSGHQLATLSDNLDRMRADRLIAALMVLQRRGSVTAAELAEELETSLRTARRDLEALSMSGIPVYSSPGRGGGWRLLDGARTDLTGLNEPEVRAVFLTMAMQDSAAPSVQAAARKLLVAVPRSLRSVAEDAQGQVYRDRRGWSGSLNAPTAESRVIATLQEGLARRRVVRVSYRKATGEESSRDLSLIGLVEKGNRWYAVAETASGRRTFRIDRMSDPRILSEPSLADPQAKVSEVWDEHTFEVSWEAETVVADLMVEPWVVPILPRLSFVLVLDEGAAQGSSAVPTRLPTTLAITVRSTSARALVGQLIGFGGAVRIVSPPEVVDLVRSLASEVVRMYADAEGEGSAPGDDLG